MQVKYMTKFHIYSKNIKEFPRMDYFSLSNDCEQRSNVRSSRVLLCHLAHFSKRNDDP